MSNDRLWLRCGYCNDIFFIGKYYPGGPPFISGEAMDEWVNKHILGCHLSHLIAEIPNGSSGTLDLGPKPLPFVFETEGSMSTTCPPEGRDWFIGGSTKQKPEDDGA